ncbi:MAG: hypothetical protein AAFV95_22050 [Bacteroidota bacterium]
MKTFFYTLTCWLLLSTAAQAASQMDTTDLSNRRLIIKLEAINPIGEPLPIGDQWKHHLFIGNRKIYEGDELVFALDQRMPLVLGAKSVEQDADYDDVGINYLILPYPELANLDRKRYSIPVEVFENAGPKYAEKAVWKFSIQIYR